jgi:hypothetical protein
MAMLLYRSAQDIFNQQIRTVQQTRRAIEDIGSAKSLFTHLLQLHHELNGQQHQFMVESSKQHMPSTLLLKA